MKIKYESVWAIYPILDRIYKNGTTNGRLLRRLRHNVKQLGPFWNDILTFLEGDAKEHDWVYPETLGGLPTHDAGFIERFANMLREGDLDYEPYYFSEALLDHIEGITGEDIERISWLFEENKPAEKEGVQQVEES